MSISRKQLAEMLIMGFDGDKITPENSVCTWIREGLGGVILFDKDLSRGGILEKNIKDIDQIQALVQNLKNERENDTPLFVAIDYEGGAVDRLRNVPGCPKTMTAQALAQLSSSECDQAVTLMAETLHTLGFNLNFAPVVDLNLNQNAGIIGTMGRSFSDRPDKVTEMAKRFVEIFNSFQIACCYKHFPGHGSAQGDTHEDFVDVTEHFRDEELLPYQNLCQSQELAYMVMTAHVKQRHLEPSGLPATMSTALLTDCLRKAYHYEGVIISDDLQMKAISNHYPLDVAIEKSISAGSDMLIFGNQLGNITLDEVVDCMQYLVNQGRLTPARIDISLKRIRRLKQKII